MATETDSNAYLQPQEKESPSDTNMPLVIPSLSWAGLDYILAPETQNLIVNYAVTSAVEHPWTTSFLTILALFAILPVLGLVITLIILAGFVFFWLGVISLPNPWKDNTVIVFIFAAAMAIVGILAAGAWLYCVALVVSTRWFLGLFTSTNMSDAPSTTTATTTTTADAGKPAAVLGGAEREMDSKKEKEVKQKPMKEEWSEKKKEESYGDKEKSLHGLSTEHEAPRKVGEVGERERMSRRV